MGMEIAVVVHHQLLDLKVDVDHKENKGKRDGVANEVHRVHLDVGHKVRGENMGKKALVAIVASVDTKDLVGSVVIQVSKEMKVWQDLKVLLAIAVIAANEAIVDFKDVEVFKVADHKGIRGLLECKVVADTEARKVPTVLGLWDHKVKRATRARMEKGVAEDFKAAQDWKDHKANEAREAAMDSKARREKRVSKEVRDNKASVGNKVCRELMETKAHKEMQATTGTRAFKETTAKMVNKGNKAMMERTEARDPRDMTAIMELKEMTENKGHKEMQAMMELEAHKATTGKTEVEDHKAMMARMGPKEMMVKMEVAGHKAMMVTMGPKEMMAKMARTEIEGLKEMMAIRGHKAMTAKMEVVGHKETTEIEGFKATMALVHKEDLGHKVYPVLKVAMEVQHMYFAPINPWAKAIL